MNTSHMIPLSFSPGLIYMYIYCQLQPPLQLLQSGHHTFIGNVVTRRHPRCLVLGYTNCCQLFLITTCIFEHLTKFSNHILLMDNVVSPGFYGPVSRLSNIDAAQALALASESTHFMATLPSLLRFKNIPKLTNLAIKKLYGLPLQAFCIHKIQIWYRGDYRLKRFAWKPRQKVILRGK